MNITMLNQIEATIHYYNKFIRKAQKYIERVKYMIEPSIPSNYNTSNTITIEEAKVRVNGYINTDHRFNDMWKIRLIKNMKEPIKGKFRDDRDKATTRYFTKDANETNRIFKCINNFNNQNNIGILTGRINNILVVDIDFKKPNKLEQDGMEDFLTNYVNLFGMPKTRIIKTRRGGFHLYFNYQSNDNTINSIVHKHLINKSGYRRSSIDVRSDGGYVVAPGCFVFDENSYPEKNKPKPTTKNTIEYIIIDNSEIIDIPFSLVQFLLNDAVKIEPLIQSENIDLQLDIEYTKPIEYFNNQMIYKFTEKQIVDLLNKFPFEYVDDTEKWFKITCSLRSSNLYKIWNNWSKQSPKYNKWKNIERYWKNLKPQMDLNFIVNLLINDGIDKEVEYIQAYKPIEPLTNTYGIKQREFNHNYVFDDKIYNCFTYDDFLNNETIVMQSTTGTGKTYAISKHIEQYLLDNSEYKFLSLIRLESLAQQHCIYFENINMESYLNCLDKNRRHFKDIKSLVICLNSIWRYRGITDYEISNMVIYIDEIYHFIDFTHNNLLEKHAKECFIMLSRFIKYAKKLIISDAMINNGVFYLFNDRINTTPSLYLKNTFKKYEGVKAVRHRNANELLDKMVENIHNKNFFFFASCEKGVATNFYNKCLKEAPEELKHLFVLITSDSKINLNGQTFSEFCKGKFIFYSPSLIYGMDFNIDEAQDVFIYITGKTINPSASYQQTTRCRNIKTLYYYCEYGQRNPKYKDLQAVKDYYKENIYNLDNHLNQICNIRFTTDDRVELDLDDKYFNLYCYNEYLNDTYETNKLLHYEQILLNEGFELIIEENIKKPLNKEIINEMKEIKEENDDILFGQFLKSSTIEKQNNILFKRIYDACYILNLDLENNDLLNNYKDILLNGKELKKHFNICRLFKDGYNINKKMVEKSQNTFLINILNDSNVKISILNKLENYYNINHVDILTLDTSEIEFKPVSNELWNHISKAFRKSDNKKDPQNWYELKQLFVSIIKNITCSEYINAERLKTKKDRDIISYSINNDFLEFHFNLLKFRNIELNNFNNIYQKIFNINDIDFIDDENDEPKYKPIKPEPPRKIQPVDNTIIYEQVKTNYSIKESNTTTFNEIVKKKKTTKKKG